uniref:Uncharacterized protein n=1 Tax=Anopheles atroparvus TaxID=41427 RepID=A0AAG5CSH5_ANOAO
MPESLQTTCFKGMVLVFVTAVVVFICFFFTLRIEQYIANNEMQRRGALRYAPDGQPNPWYFFVRDIPTIQSLASLPFLNVPTIERTEKGFKVRGRDYEATYERISRADCDDDATDSSAKQVPTKEQPEPDFALTMVKGKTHYWKNRIGKPITLQKIDMHGEIKQKEREASPSGNAIPVDDGTVKM